MNRIGSIAVLAGLAAATQAQTVAFTDFSNGPEGWAGNGGAQVQTGSGGNSFLRIPGIVDMFWFEFWNDSNPDWIGDYTAKGELLEFSLDIQTNSITVFGNPVDNRPVILEFRNFNYDHDFYPYASVYVELGRVTGFAQDWTTMSTVFDPNAIELPEGWGAYGNEDDLGNWILPDGATFADMMSGVGEIVIHSAEYGAFYPFTNFDLMIDNLHLRNVPTPGTLALLGLAGLSARRRR